MKIAIFTLGTRGDVQPYAVLGKALKARGHKVTLSTAKNFAALVQSYGLDFVPVDADFQAMIESEEVNKMRKNPFLAKKQLSKYVYPMMDSALTTFYSLAKENDKVLFHVKTMADNFADQFAEKMIMANVVPAVETTAEFANPVFSFMPLPKWLNSFTYKITDWGLKMWKKPVSDFRKKVGLPIEFTKTHMPAIYGISEHLLQKPADFAPDRFFTGFWTEASDTALHPDLLDFLSKGEPPLLITFGSMPFDTKLDIKEAIKRIIHTYHIRVIVVKGWGIKDTKELEGHPLVKVIDAAPYDKLLPLVKAVVQHGGVGTMAACLQAGKPVMTCPVLYPLGDQHFWGTIAYKKGVGLKPIPLKNLTYQKFIDDVGELIGNSKLHENAMQLAGKLAQQDGVKNAIDIIEQSHKQYQ